MPYPNCHGLASGCNVPESECLGTCMQQPKPMPKQLPPMKIDPRLQHDIDRCHAEELQAQLSRGEW